MARLGGWGLSRRALFTLTLENCRVAPLSNAGRGFRLLHNLRFHRRDHLFNSPFSPSQGASFFLKSASGNERPPGILRAERLSSLGRPRSFNSQCHLEVIESHEFATLMTMLGFALVAFVLFSATLHVA